MAICTFCDQEMLTVPSCLVEVLHQDSVAYRLPTYGKERHYGRFRPRDRCTDCGVRPGRFHHLGCDWQECPVCFGQLLSCGCRFDEDPPDPDEQEWVA